MVDRLLEASAELMMTTPVRVARSHSYGRIRTHVSGALRIAREMDRPEPRRS